MDAKLIKQAVLTAACLLAFGPALAEAVQQAGIPNTFGGKFISCRNPLQTLGIVRAKDATIVFQTRPSGVQWKVRLPPMVAEYDQYWVAPDGSAAVVAVSVNDGADSRAFLVSGHHEPIEFHGGVVTVDFQGDRVLIATADSKNDLGYRVRVYQRDSGELVGDTSFETEFGDDFRRFLIRLAGDGQSYYYIPQKISDGPVIKDVVSGKQRALGYQISGGVEDMLLYSKDRGYVVTGNKVYALGDRGLIPIQDADIGPIYYLVESEDSSIQPVRSSRGWGVFHTRSNTWLMTSDEGTSLYSSGSVVTVVDQSADSKSVKAFDFSGLKPRLVRGISGNVVNNSLTCANEYGFMDYKGGDFTWHRSK